MLTTFISLGALGVTTIGGAILEKHLVKNDHVAADQICKRWNVSRNENRWCLFYWLCIYQNLNHVLGGNTWGL